MNILKILLMSSIGLITIGNSGAYGQTFTVTSPLDGTGNGTLRWAVLQANNITTNATIEFDQSLDFSPIQVTQGRMFITKSINIVGNGIGHTLIDGQSISQVFAIGGNIKVNIRKLSFQNCKKVGNPSFPAGSAILLFSGFLTLENCRFVNNQADLGGAIYQAGGVLVIRKSLFDGNSATQGAALNLEGGFTTLSDCDLTNNSVSHFGPAIHAFASNELTIINSKVRGNHNLTVGNSTGGALSLNGNHFTLVNTVLSGNKGRGGALFITSNGEIINCTITGNYSNYTSGNAIIVGGGANVELKNNIIARNKGLTTNQLSIGQPGSTITSSGGNFFDVSPTSVVLQPSDLSGTSSVPLDPKFITNPANVWPSIYGNFALKSCSDAINIGLNSNLPLDATDIDGDGNKNEVLPLDILRNARVSSGSFITSIADAGAYEYGGIPTACAATPPLTALVSLFPNPTQGAFSVKLINKEDKIKAYKIYNRYGKLIQEESLRKPTNSIQVTLENQRSATYLLQTFNMKGEKFENWFILE